MIRRRAFLPFAAVTLLPACATYATTSGALREALAPTGTLRVGLNFGSPLSLVRDASGQPRGVLHDLAREMASQLGVALQLVEFRSVPDLVAALKTGQIDVTGTNATPARAAEIEFTKTLIETELGYLAPPNSTMQSAEDAKRAGLRIGVAQGSTSQTVLPGLMPQATIVPVPGLPAVAAMLRNGAIDVFTTNKVSLFEISDRVQGSRVLPGQWGLEEWAIAVSKQRIAVKPHLEVFLARARESGVVRAAMDRAGLRGARMV